MICPNCATDNDVDAKFCAECGAGLRATCPTCGAAVKPGAKFCSECGTALGPTATGSGTGIVTVARPAAAGPGGLAPAAPAPTATPIAASRAPVSSIPASAAPGAPSAEPAPVAERRLVSVLFADLAGFTPFAEQRDVEQVRETLSRYFDLASEVIGRYGGTVEKFIGDAVMAVWGAPVAREDDAERAVRAALEVVDAVRALGPDIQARAGVLTGEAAVTLGAVGQGMVAGDLVNTASRLQSAAPPGAVLVGEATYRAASRAIAFEEAGGQTLKGKASPVPAWRAIRVVAELGGRNRAETLEAPFVGRDEEFRLLKDSFHATGREKKARLVSIMGPAGIGKSRLAWEFSKYTDGLVETTYWHVGRSPAYGDGITFWALGEMVRRRMGLTETADEATTRAKVAEGLAEWVPDEGERRWIEQALLALLGLERGSAPEELFGAWRTLFERIAEKGTVTLVFEDLHWADSGTLDFIDHLLEWSKNVPIYVVTLARPELLDKRPDWGAGKRNFISLHLEPLPERAMRELLIGLVPGLPELTAREIVGRADGVPLYAVETVRMLVAEGKLRLEGQAYVPAGDLSELAVPETLTALISARLDSLEPGGRVLLQDAAVLGQSFSPAALAAISGLEGAGLEGRLRALVRGELLEVEADPRSPERGQYSFVQALIREVAYNTLARRDRKTKHLAAARFFESLGSDELAGALAGHYLAAHSYATEGPEADALAGQARVALRAAAERALALSSYAQAVRFFEQALTVTPDRAEQAVLHERAGEAASVASRHEAAERHLRTAIELQRGLGDRPGIARSTAALGRALVSARRADVAEPLLEAAQAEFADLDPGPERAALGGQLARAAWMNGKAGRAIELADPALDMAEHLDLVPIVTDTLITKGGALAQVGRMAEGLALMRAGQELAEEHGLIDAVLRAIGNRSGYESGQDPRTALEIGRAGLAMGRRLGIRTTVATGNSVFCALRVGEWPWALDVIDEALGEDLEQSDRTELFSLKVAFRALLGEPVEEMVAELERLSADATDVYRRLAIVQTRAWLALVVGRFGESHGHWRQFAHDFESPADLPWAARTALWDRDGAAAREDLALFDAAGIHGPALEADRTTIRAGIAALEGRPTEALALYRQALRSWRDLGLAWDEALCGLDMALLLDPAEPEVRAAAESSREILARLGARPFLERLQAALARSPAPRPATAAAEAAPADVITARATAEVPPEVALS